MDQYNRHIVLAIFALLASISLYGCGSTTEIRGNGDIVETDSIDRFFGLEEKVIGHLTTPGNPPSPPSSAAGPNKPAIGLKSDAGRG